MWYFVLLASIVVLGKSSDGVAGSAAEVAELTAIVEELGRRAREQEKVMAMYEEAAAAARKLLPADAKTYGSTWQITGNTIYNGSDLKAGMIPYSVEQRLEGGLDVIWILLCSSLVMLMQAGFTMMESGLTHWRNVQSVLSKNLNTVFFATFGWWIFGWSFAYSGPYKRGNLKENLFSGKEQFAGHHFLITRADGQQEPSIAIADWMFTWAKAMVAALIASGGMTERSNFPGPAIFAFMFASFIFPFPSAWSYGHGWLQDPEDMNAAGFVDLGGSGMICFVGGVAALLASVLAGRRPEYFADSSPGDRMQYFPGSNDPHAVSLVVMGALLIWFGWYGFNCGSVAKMNTMNDSLYAAQIAMNTTIAAAAGGLLVMTMRSAINRKLDVGGGCAGIIAGLVSISAACGSVEVGSALAIAVVGALFYQMVSLLLRIAKVDDVTDSFAIYGASGMWGVIAAPLFDWGMGWTHAHGNNGFNCIREEQAGEKCLSDAATKQLAANFALLGAVFLWVAVMSAVVLVLLRVTKLLAPSKDMQLSAWVWPAENDGSSFENGGPGKQISTNQL